jgi:hypothetical protein
VYQAKESVQSICLRRGERTAGIVKEDFDNIPFVIMNPDSIEKSVYNQ